MSFREALHFFLPGVELAECIALNRGKVNDTWLIHPAEGEAVILQRLPAAVFPDPHVVMRNIQITSDRLHHFFLSRDDAAMTSYVLHTSLEGESTYVDGEGNGWRLISYIPDSRTVEPLTTPTQGFEIGRALGLFHRATLGLNPDLLTDPLPGLHDTPAYLHRYDTVSPTSPPVSDTELSCSRLIANMREIATLLHTPGKRFTTSIIHGDPKSSNFLFAQGEDRVISIIDLDTVKPGLLLHDLGDCLRSCCNLKGEEQQVPQEAVFDPIMFQAVLQGYEHTAGEMLAGDDIQYLVDAAKLICFELGLRFFTDHLQGDIYFKTDRPGQNLHRALIQLHLAASIEEQERVLQDTVDTIFRKR